MQPLRARVDSAPTECPKGLSQVQAHGLEKAVSTLFRGQGLLLNDIDFSQACPNERFECLTCSRTMILTTSGRCANCGSDAVISVEKLEAPCTQER